MRAAARRTLLTVSIVLYPAVLGGQGNVVVRRHTSEDIDKWNFTLAASRPLGGPAGQMEDRLLEEGWTEHFCNAGKSTCHDNPLIGAPQLSLTSTLSGRIAGNLAAGATFSYSNLGSAEGRRSGTHVRADWSAAMLAVSLSYRPVRLLRISAGPLLSVLNSQTTVGTPRSVVRPGALLEIGVRSTATRQMYLELSATYRLIGKRLEGPWPGFYRGLAAPAGPTPFNVNFSHFSISLGLGWRTGF